MNEQQIRDDLEYVSKAVRRNEISPARPEIYVFWALAILIGFSLPDFAPKYAGWYWLVTAVAGGLGTSFYAGYRERRDGVIDVEGGRRWGLHFLVGGVGYAAVFAAMWAHPENAAQWAPSFLLVTGLLYALAGIHLDRGMLLSGILGLAGYAVLMIWSVSYVWTATGVIMCAALLLAAVSTARNLRTARA